MLLMLLACFIRDEDVTQSNDPDGDGFGASEDCAPLDPTVNPGAEEIWYDGVDQDCDGGSDNDQDGDGFDATAGVDCDDSDARVSPGAEEICGDGVVNSCEMTEEEARAMCRLQGELSLAEADLKIVGAHPAQRLGTCVSSAGDINNDGRADLFLGARCNDCDEDSIAGAAYLFLSSDELLSARSVVGPSMADLQLIGEMPEDEAGAAIHYAGDVDGDEFADLVVGAHQSGRGGYYAGAVYLILSSGALMRGGDVLDLDNADLILVGEGTGDRAGETIATAGDVDNDGKSDLLIGAQNQGGDGAYRGAAYLLLASGALAAPGRTLNLAEADLKLVGEGSGDYAGSAVAAAGDVDGDGSADIMVGAQYHDADSNWVGAAYLLLSPATLSLGGATLSLGDTDIKLIGEDMYNIAGAAAAGVSDVDGDGKADLLIGAPGNTEGGLGAGAAYLALSSGALNMGEPTINLSEADIKLVGEGGTAGSAVAGAGDVDGDDKSDLLVGAYQQDRGGSSSGTAYLLLSSGALSSDVATLDLQDADLKLVGEGVNDEAGASVSSAGDINADGLQDLLISAPFHGVEYPDSGAAYVILGRSF